MEGGRLRHPQVRLSPGTTHPADHPTDEGSHPKAKCMHALKVKFDLILLHEAL
jgi:hypothetical protein